MSVLFFRNCLCPLLLKIRRLMKRPKLVNAMMLCQCLLPATVLSSAQGTNCKQPSANFVPCQQCMHDSVNVRHIIITMYLHLLINKIFLFLFLRACNSDLQIPPSTPTPICLCTKAFSLTGAIAFAPN